MKPSSTDEIAPLSELLRRLGEEARSCWVRVTDGERDGTLRFEHGELAEIVFGQLRGATAMFALMEASNVRYEVLDTLVTPEPDIQGADAPEGAALAADALAVSPELKLAIDEAAMRAWMEATDPGVPTDAAEAEGAAQATLASARSAFGSTPNGADAEGLSAEAPEVERADKDAEAPTASDGIAGVVRADPGAEGAPTAGDETVDVVRADPSAEGAPTASDEIAGVVRADASADALEPESATPVDAAAAASSAASDAEASLEPPGQQDMSEGAVAALAKPDDGTPLYEDDVPTRPLGPERERALATGEPTLLETQESPDATDAHAQGRDADLAFAPTEPMRVALRETEGDPSSTTVSTQTKEDARADLTLAADSAQTQPAEDKSVGAANHGPTEDALAPKAVGARRSDWPRPERPRPRKLATSTLLGVGAAALLATLLWRPAPEAARTPERGSSDAASTLARLGEGSRPTGAAAGAAQDDGADDSSAHEVPEWIEGPAPEAPQGALVPTIVLRVLVGTDGKVREAQVDSPRPQLAELEQKALEIARSHRFRPAVRGGVPVEAWTTLPLSFDPSVVERTLVVQGSDVLTSGLGLAWAAAVERARPGLRVRREGFGSRGGLAALLRGHAELALSTRPLDDAELALAHKLGVSLRELLVGYDGVAVITHPDNPVRALDLATLAKIYAGEFTQWSELHGAAAPIRVLGRPSYAAAHGYFAERVLATLGEQARFDAAIEVLESSDDIVSQVAADVHAIGYVSLSHVNASVRALELRREAQAPAVAPSAATLRDGSYPLARPLLFYLRSDAGADARALVEAAFSKAGQAALAQHGLMPRPSGEPLSLEPAYASAPVTRSTPHPIYFQPGGALLAKGAWSKLRALGTALGDDKRALVVGNTDSTGSAEINQRVAERRARLVAAVLREYNAEAPIDIENASSDQPLATNATEEGRTLNRRVDVFLLPR